MDNYIDPASLTGTMITIWITYFGFVTINEYAVIIGIGCGIATLVLTILKAHNELKRGKILSKEIKEQDENEDDEN
jgi:hypothetical protein